MNSKTRNWKKAVALLSAFALLFVYLPVTSVSKAATMTVYHEDFASGVGKAVQAGSPTLTTASGVVFEGNDDGKAVYISNRNNDYDGFDLKFADVGMGDGKTYNITVKGYVAEGVSVPSGAQAAIQNLSPSTDSYGWVGGAVLSPGLAFTITGDYTVDTSKDDRIRIQTASGSNVPFYVGDILITGENSAPSTPTAPSVYSNGFEDAGVTGFFQSGTAALSVSTDQHSGGAQSLKVVTAGSQAYDGAQISGSAAGVTLGKKYHISAKVYTPDQPVQLVMQVVLKKSSDSSNDWKWLANKTYTSSDTGWSTFESDLDLTTGEYNAIDNIQFVKGGGSTTNITFYIDDFTVTDLSAAPSYSNGFEDAGVTDFYQSGAAALSVSTDQKSGGAQSLKVVTTGSQAYDGAQISGSAAGVTLGKKYHISARVYAPDQPVQLVMQVVLKKSSDGSNDWKWLSNKTYSSSDNGWSTFESDLDLTTGDYNAIDNIQFVKGGGNTTNITFYIDDFIVTDIGGGSGDDEDPGQTTPAAVFIPIDFEDQTTGDFAARGGVESVTVSNEANHTTGGTYSLKTTGRQQDWQGPSLDVSKYIDKGSKYKVTVWAKLITPSSASLDLSTQIGSSSPSYSNINKKQVTTADGWVEISGEYTYNTVPDNYATIYLQSPTVSAEYYIDDISFVKTGSAPTAIENDLAAIKDVYKDDFLIGTAISSTDLSGLRFDLMKKHFNVATAGNDMKPESLQKVKGQWTWTGADNLVQKVLDAGFQMHGHVLAWHSQSPAWLNTQVDGSGNALKDESGNVLYLSRTEALANMRDYITTVINHFGNKVISWDVVNEAMNDNPSNPSDWKASLRKTPWYYAIGDDYVEQAFLIAREAIDANPALQGIKLYYNDYNEDNQKKAEAIYSMVKDLNDKYGATHNGKKLIDGIGMQAHYNMGTNPDSVKLSLEKFISLGVEVSITELDIMCGSNSTLTTDQAKAQGYLYAQLFKIFKEHSANIKRVTIWGMDDGESWRKENSPLPFDANLRHKPAYDGIIDPVKYMTENPPPALTDVKQGTARYGTPVIDGTVDTIWSSALAMQINQYLQAWQGAAGTVKAMWDNRNLYLLYQVDNSVLDKTSTNPWEQDSVEAFVDENNMKTISYQDDDGQYRVNYANEASFNPSGISAGFVSAATTAAGANYTVEMKIPFKAITPADNVKIGFDAQINDGEAGSRISAATWNDTKGIGYQDTSVYGVLTLTGKNPSGGNSGSNPGTTAGGTQDTTTTVVTSQDGKSAATATITSTAPDSNGKVAASIDTNTLNNLASLAKDAEAKGQSALVEIKVDSSETAKAVSLELPKDALVKLAQDTKASVKIDAGVASITFDAKSMDSLGSQLTGEKVNVSISKVDAASLPQDVKAIVGSRPVFDISVTSGNTAITNFGGGKLQIAIPYTPGFGENRDAIIVNYIGSDGKLNTVRGRYDQATGMVICVTTHLSTFAVSYNNVTFKDVSASAWYKNAVAFIGARGISDGIGGGKFGPDKNLTRAEFLVMLMRAYQIAPDANPSANFADAGNTYYTGYLAAAKRLGISDGTGGNLFAPNRTVTRQEMFTLLYNALKSIDELPAAKAGISFASFSDSGSVDQWAKEAMKSLTEAGIVTGDNGRLNPSGTASRSESAQTLYNLLNS